MKSTLPFSGDVRLPQSTTVNMMIDSIKVYLQFRIYPMQLRILLSVPTSLHHVIMFQ